MRRPTLLLVLAGVLWGTGGITGHALADATGLSAVALGAYRLTVGGAVLALAAALTGSGRPRTRAHWQRIAVIAALAGLYQAAYFAAVALSAVGIATLVTIGSSPLALTVIEAVRDRRPPDRGPAATHRPRPGRARPAHRVPEHRHECRRRRARRRAGPAQRQCVRGVRAGRPGPGTRLGQPAAVGTGFVVGGLVLGVVSFTVGGPGFAVDAHSAGCWPCSSPSRPPWPTGCTSPAWAGPRPRPPSSWRCSSR